MSATLPLHPRYICTSCACEFSPTQSAEGACPLCDSTKIVPHDSRRGQEILMAEEASNHPEKGRGL